MTTKGYSKNVSGILQTHKHSDNFFSKKENIVLYFILLGLKIVQTNDPNSGDLKEQIQNFYAGHSPKEILIGVDKLTKIFKEQIYYLILSVVDDSIDIISKPLNITRILTYLFHIGMEDADNSSSGEILDTIMTSDAYNLLIKQMKELSGENNSDNGHIGGNSDEKEEREEKTEEMDSRNVDNNFDIVDNESPKNQIYIVFDGSNIARWDEYDGKGTLKKVQRVKKYLISKGIPESGIYTVFGAGLRHRLPNGEKDLYKYPESKEFIQKHLIKVSFVGGKVYPSEEGEDWINNLCKLLK